MLAFLTFAVAFAQRSTPTGLLCDLKKSPALGVTANPHFSWIVPAGESSSAGHVSDTQTSYTLNVSRGATQIWTSGLIASNASTYVAYGGPKLQGGSQYTWTVSTTSGGSESAASAPATFVTALVDGWSPSAKFISLVPTCVQSGAVAPQVNCSYYGYFRKEITIPSGMISGSAFITAASWGIFDTQLSNYKLYIDGKLVGLGPGRGEAPVWEGNGQFKSMPYNTLDVTSFLSPGKTSVFSIQALHHGGPTGPSPIMQLNLELQGSKTATVATDNTWLAFNGDLHRKPGPALHGNSAGI